ncbi:type VI secretion system lipoprotein TssJ [Flexibacterium corallicola]|uniref:type VI secretion system lipoprotein TssJ n=1 Tax=Flexibacterium corallicola TaxID=3037259 RepID=UPI00286EE0CB|nr:type VI secretion system lipoprotein TssJ [Pseudovibrio sp. M1P-2-3]
MRHFLILAVCLLVAACAGSKVSVPEQKVVGLSGGANINRYNDSSNPVVLRFYQLSSRSQFESASFWEIYNDSSEELAGVIIDRESIAALYPKEARLVNIELQPDTRYLGVFAEYADYETQRFRASLPISPETFEKGVTVSVGASGVEIHNRKSPLIRKKSFFSWGDDS